MIQGDLSEIDFSPSKSVSGRWLSSPSSGRTVSGRQILLVNKMDNVHMCLLL